jgi:hypothetical protein
MWEKRQAVGKHEGDNVFNLGVDWRIILKWIIKK